MPQIDSQECTLYPVGNPLAAGTATRPLALSCKVHAHAHGAQGVCAFGNSRDALCYRATGGNYTGFSQILGMAGFNAPHGQFHVFLLSHRRERVFVPPLSKSVSPDRH
jgi:hypothetical protein